MDYSKVQPVMLIGIGVFVIALSLGYYFIKKADFLLLDRRSKELKEKEQDMDN